MTGKVSQSPRASARRSRKSIAHFPGASDQENNTISGAITSASVKPSKKTRSKSIGPGALADILSESTGNSQRIAPVIRSILKPTIALSPIKQIPPRNKNATLTQSGRISLAASRASEAQVEAKLEAKRQADEEALEREKREIQERRDARRKSLANRRVSFAPEATLHTWDIVELAEDATTSSEGTNLTHRTSTGSNSQSGTITGNGSVFENPVMSDPPSTPPHHEIQVAASPAHQRDLHQKQNRRDSDAHSVATEDLENFSSPGDSVNSASPGENMDLDVSEDSDEDKDSVIDGTVTGRINDDDSIHSESPDHTGSTSSSARLDHSLRQAVIQAGNQDLTIADGNDMTMDLIEDDTALLPVMNLAPANNPSRTKSQENINPFSPAFAAEVSSPGKGDESEMSMDMTVMMGGIINGGTGSPKKGKRKSIAPTNRRSMARRRSSVESSVVADETMDLVTTYGGIQAATKDNETASFGDQEMSMDLTKAIGGVLTSKAASVTYPELQDQDGDGDGDVSMNITRAIGSLIPTTKVPHAAQSTKRTDQTFNFDEQEMDMTVANGRLLSPVTERTEPSENNSINMDFTRTMGQILRDDTENTMGMDMTKAVGSILPKELQTNSKMAAKQLMEEEADHSRMPRSPLVDKTIPKVPTSSGLRVTRSMNSPVKTPNYLNATKSTSSKSTTPSKTPGTPSKQLTPQPNRPTTPSKTPPNPNISMRKTSPKRLFKTSTGKSPKTATPSLQGSKDILDSASKPLITLTPSNRRASGIGIDQIGVGSPMIAAKLDRRASIGDSTPNFVPSGRKALRFEDPRVIEFELDNERAEDARRESGRGVLEHEAEGQDSTTNLRDMIKSLTPKKNKFKGRKSLAPSAKGILGKRPIELDDEEDEDATPKKLKGNRSPVKSIHLPGPSRESTLRLSVAPQFTLPTSIKTPNLTGLPPKTASTPKDQGRFHDAVTVINGEAPPASFNEQLDGAVAEPEAVDDAQISLQDFLDLTNIRFMDLTTTKRRHTTAVVEGGDSSQDKTSEATLADCIVAGVRTIPMLELFQHSCRELKKYIAEGRSVVKEIENDTLEDNPALFQEYMAAAPDIREIMDNQFKNIKVHARGESKATWYEWRSKLFEGLKSGLVSIHEGLLKDDQLLGQQEELLHGRVTDLVEQHSLLKKEAELLQSHADELANCDQNELHSVRAQLVQREQDIKNKKALLAELQAELAESTQAVKEAEERKMETMAEIREAERVTDENKGWSYEEVKALKDKVDVFEQQSGWGLHTCDESHPTFAYKKSIYLYVGADLGEQSPVLRSQEPISLSYEPRDSALTTTELPVVHRFFLQNLKARLSVLPFTSPTPSLRSVLELVSTGWDLAETAISAIAGARLRFHTTEQIVDDSTLMIQSMILLRAPEETKTQSKLHIQFFVKLSGEGTSIASKVEVKAKVVYGEAFKEKEMVRFIESRIKNSEGKLGIGAWREALMDLKAHLLRGKIAVS